MRHCVDCSFHKRMPGQDPMGRQMMVDACTHSECTEPVTGSPLFCAEARQNEMFCGLKKATHFKKKETEAEPAKGSVIELG